MRDVTNLLYRHPEWYETVYDGDDHAVARLAETVFEAHLGRMPASLLDIGCGTGRDLEYLAKHVPDAIGVDYQQAMVDYARRQRPTIEFRTGDMRTLRLGRTFEAVTSFGLALANVHANQEIDRAMATFAAHSAPGAVLILEVLDPGKLHRLPRRFTIDAPGFRAEAKARYVRHSDEDLLERHRAWRLPDGGEVHDNVRFRVLYPPYLTSVLDRHGFEFRAAHALPGAKNAASMFVVAQHRLEA